MKNQGNQRPHTLEELMLQRNHLMQNIALADNKAQMIYNLYINNLATVESKVEFINAYKRVITAVTEAPDREAPEDFEVYSADFSYDTVSYELEVLSAITKAKYEGVVKMLSVAKKTRNVKMYKPIGIK